MGSSDFGGHSNQPLNVALFFEHPTLNGGERSTLAFCDQLSDQGFAFYAIAPFGCRIEAMLQQFRIVHVPFLFRDSNGTRLSLEALRSHLADTIGELRIDLFHAISLSASRIAGPVISALKLPGIAHLRDIMRISRRAMQDINMNNLILAVSQATLAYHRHAGLNVERSTVQYNGIDLHRFKPDTGAGTLRCHLGLDSQARILGTAGQIILRKGLDVTVQAFRRVADRYPTTHLVIAGERHSDKNETMQYEETIHAVVRDHQLENRVHFLGFYDNMSGFYNELELFVHSARQEPLGRVLLEAAGCGCPVVATNVGGTQEIFPQINQAVLIQPNDPRNLSRHICRLLSDADAREELAENGRQAVEERFDIRFRSRELAGHYRKIASI
tara:strand:+ start:2630 stop:3787 length:1158 start_codon:yes stop_codon:yes gene_type:complete